MAYLNVTRLNKHYGQTQVFQDIDFTAEEGEFVTLLGPSGCGKSTLLRCLAGLTPVDSGQILLQGQDLVPLAHPQEGVDALKGRFEGPTRPIPGVVDKNAASAGG